MVMNASPHIHTNFRDKFWHETQGIIKSLGLVFGDIGTSPIYTLTVIFLLLKPTQENVLGVLSLVVWTLIILVTIEYAWLAMSLGEKGEGGTIVLRGILIRLLKTGRGAVFITILTFVGISLLVGDGVITPAISILSAVEGILLIPGLQQTKQIVLILIAAGIAIALFAVQKKGTERVAGAFGPLMCLWFMSLGVAGLISIAHTPLVWKSINPYYVIKFLYNNGLAGYLVLSEVILCATGGEALYADMGHLGRKPILRAWYFVFFALLLNYLGHWAFSRNLILIDLDQQHGDPMILFYVSLGLGVVHLSISYLMGVFQSLSKQDRLQKLGLMGVLWGGVCLISQRIWFTDPAFTMNHLLYYGGLSFLACGLLLTFLFASDSKRLIVRLGLGLWSVYGLTGLVGDLLSYARLFGLGIATTAIASVMNDLAGMVHQAGGTIVGGILAVLVLVLGHTFNLLLSILGSTVHSARLHFVETFKSFFQGGGTEYKPFKVERG
jgi:KUP system potassium uptake protein